VLLDQQLSKLAAGVFGEVGLTEVKQSDPSLDALRKCLFSFFLTIRFQNIFRHNNGAEFAREIAPAKLLAFSSAVPS
jgi:hypothetical protein